MKEYLLQDKYGKYAYKVGEGSFDFTDDKKKAFHFGDWHDDLVKRIKNIWNSKRGPFKKVNPGSFFESLELPINKGDILKFGKFKNKSFEFDHAVYDEKGGIKAVDPNGKETSLLAVRLSDINEEYEFKSFKVYLKESINFKPGEYLIYNPDFIDGIKFHDPRYNTKVLFVGRYDNQNALIKSTNNISHMENLSTRDFDNTEKVPLKMLMNLKDYEKYKSNRK